MKAKIKVIILSEYLLFSEGLEKIIEHADDIDVIGKATNIKDTISLFGDIIPDIIIVDLEAGKTRVEKLIRHIELNKLPVKILLLVNENGHEIVLRNMVTGIRGCLLKKVSSSEMVKAIRAVHRDEIWMSRRLMTELINQYSNKTAKINELTRRENDITRLIVQGLSNKEIATSLLISEKTVKSHVTRIFLKTGVDSRVKLAVKLLPDNQVGLP